ncbi:MAG: Crp/Fnr family transcriptional regulator [Bacteroidota bacterium]
MANLKGLLPLFRHLTIRTVEKGEVLVERGATQKELFFIRKGMVRSYFLNEKLEEITFQLFPEYYIFGNIHAVLFDEPSHFCFQALEKTKVYSIDYTSYFELSSKNPDVSQLNMSFLGKKVVKQAFQRVESFVALTPEERYRKYAKDHPNIIGRAPDKYIANVLGITPVSLSRIRNRIASKVD